ncbi:serine carboxypeptidase S28-domain-containing protein [Lactarius quietus]|nr:serine carboxypeptidase S28-domain-containing protein [Lactarius quietus]
MLAVLSLLASVSLAYALVPKGFNAGGFPPRPLPPTISAPHLLEHYAFQIPNSDEEHPALNTVYYFDQYIDHSNFTLGTFQQRYWMSWEFYQPGGPIILSTPGEEDATCFMGYLTNKTINGQIAQQQQGATILIEHRFYGGSNPYKNLSVASFKYHTIDQAIKDLVFFAKNVTLPFAGGDNVSHPITPWVLVGGSYAGTLTAYTLHQYPDVFWAGYASSAPVQGIIDFWQYFEPIRQNMPANCSNDVQGVIEHWDEVIDSGNKTAFNELKILFGLGDFVNATASDVVNTLRYPLFEWQLLSPVSRGGDFYNFCDTLEVINGTFVPDADGRGLGHALNAWADYSREAVSNTCTNETGSISDCLSLYYNETSINMYNVTFNNSARSWRWTVCTELGFFQTSAPLEKPTLVSHHLQVSYYESQCIQLFGDVSPNVNATNKVYGGYNIQAERLFVANGRRDPWRYATLSTDNVNITSTPERPIAESDGFHGSDLVTKSGLADPTVGDVQNLALQYMKQWLAKDQGQKNSSRTSKLPDIFAIGPLLYSRILQIFLLAHFLCSHI